MFFFNKNKDKEDPVQAVSTPAPKPASADDFFADLDRRQKAKPVAEQEVKLDVDVPDVSGLREEPAIVAPSSMNDVQADLTAAENLTDKTLGSDDAYHGNMNDAYFTEEKPNDPEFDPSKAVTADDFFSNMGKKAVSKPTAEPVVLREEPLPEVGSSMNGLDITELTTDALRDKSIENDELYHGDMNDIPDEINTDSLAVKHFKSDADDSGNIYSDDDYELDESNIVIEEINE